MSELVINTDTNGKLLLGGIPATDLAAKYGTPLYVMEEDKIVTAMRQYRKAFEGYEAGAVVNYASKAFSCKEMYRIAAREGLGVDVVSGGELYTALSAGFEPSGICFHGNNKTVAELEMALNSGVGMIVADNLSELARIDAICEKEHRVAAVSLRVKPGIEAHTHDYVKTGQIDSKFGLALENGEAMEGVKAVLKSKNLRLAGLHSHIGSQIFDAQPFADSAAVMLKFIAQIRDETGYTVTRLDLGGGIGISYVSEDNPQSVAVYIKALIDAVKECCEKLSLPYPELSVEPGRSIVAPAGTTLYTVGSVKEIRGVRNYVAIDGGMTDNPRYALYGSKYTALIADRAASPKDYIATIAGHCCESGDLIGENMPIQKPKDGDILAVLCTGAYNYSMASNYNRVPRPPVVFVSDGKSRLVIKRESYEDICRLDI